MPARPSRPNSSGVRGGHERDGTDDPLGNRGSIVRRWFYRAEILSGNPAYRKSCGPRRMTSSGMPRTTQVTDCTRSSESCPRLVGSLMGILRNGLGKKSLRQHGDPRHVVAQPPFGRSLRAIAQIGSADHFWGQTRSSLRAFRAGSRQHLRRRHFGQSLKMWVDEKKISG